MLEKLVVIPHFISLFNYSQPNLPSERINQLYAFNKPYHIATKSCPNPSQAKSLLPKYGLENAIAEFGISFTAKDPLENGPIHDATYLYFRAYNSKSKSGKVVQLKGKKILNFLINGRYNIIEIYKKLNNSLHDKPSAVIYKGSDKLYLLFDLKSKNSNFADGNFDYIECAVIWNHDLVFMASKIIIVAEIIDKLKKHPVPSQELTIESKNQINF